MKKNNSSLLFIFITIFIDITGLGIIIPVIPALLTELIGGTLSEAAMYSGWLMFSYAILQFLFAPVLNMFTLSNFLETGKENEILFSKIRSLVLQVLDADSHDMTKKVFESSLKKDFQIEACSLEFLDQKSLINLADATKLNLLKSEVFSGTFNIKNLKTHVKL